jgi:hypothetical protein
VLLGRRWAAALCSQTQTLRPPWGCSHQQHTCRRMGQQGNLPCTRPWGREQPGQDPSGSNPQEQLGAGTSSNTAAAEQQMSVDGSCRLQGGGVKVAHSKKHCMPCALLASYYACGGAAPSTCDLDHAQAVFANGLTATHRMQRSWCGWSSRW